MELSLKELLTVTFALFAVIDIVGAMPDASLTEIVRVFKIYGNSLSIY